MPLSIDTRSCSPWVYDAAGSDQDVVISSRVRYARNLVSYPFPSRCSAEESRSICKEIEVTAEKVFGQQLNKVRIDELGRVEKNVLLERRLASRDLLKSEMAAVIYDSDESFGIMVNEEDHLRLQKLASGNNLSEVFFAISAAERELDEVLNFAFSERWGYLTACPTNLGSGMRASTLMHIPGLVLTQKINKVLAAISNLGLTVRGFYGEGSGNQGFYFQISNQVTLGRPEAELCQTLQRVIGQIIKQERMARKNLFSNTKPEIQDRIGRAYGILSNARRIDTTEAQNLISLCRLGVGSGVIPKQIDLAMLDSLLFLTQPGHLEHSLDQKLKTSARDYYRAEKIRREFKKNSSEKT